MPCSPRSSGSTPRPLRSLRTCALLAAFFFSVALSSSEPLRAQEQPQQMCRKTCQANEVIDAAGCCMALDWKRSSQTHASSPSSRKIADSLKKSHLRAQHFSAVTGPESTLSKRDHIEALRKVSKTLKEGTATAGGTLSMHEELLLSSDRLEHLWATWLHIDQELSVLLAACHADKEPGEELSSTCSEQLSLKVEEREAWKKIATPQLEATRARARHWLSRDREEADPLASPLEAQSLYYQTAMALTLHDDDTARSTIGQILELDKESPYTAFSYMSLADRLLEADRVESASRLYLQAMAHPHNPARAYAMYRQAECLLVLGNWSEAMRVLILAVEEMARGRHQMVRGRELSREVMLEIIELYAQTGAPADAPDFFAALGVPDTIVPIYIERLAGRYEAHGRVEEATMLRQALDRLEAAQESPSGEGTSMPRSR